MFDDWYMDENNKKQFNGHTGYLNFWPLFLEGALEKPEQVQKLKTTIKKLADPATGLWTKYGIRSLSSNDPYYKKGENYWTSPIWMNINFLITSALFRFSEDVLLDADFRAEIKQIYSSLRLNLINMIADSYDSTGFIWEVYDGDSGAGMDNHPFTGWSALYTNLMAEVY